MSTVDEPAGAGATADEAGGEDGALRRLERQVLARRQSYPQELAAPLRTELEAALAQAREASAEIITVMNPVSRPTPLKLGRLVEDTALDTMYAQEWDELSVSDAGVLYLVYRRRNGDHYAIEWTPATTLPPTMMACLSPALAAALLESDVES